MLLTRTAAASGAGAAAPISAIAANGWQTTMVTPADLSLSPISISRPGYTTSFTTTTYTDTAYTTKRVRQVYANQASFTTSDVATDRWFYSTDNIAGVTNNSALTVPQPVASWMMADRQLTGNSVFWEITAYHIEGRANQQVPAVRVRGNDGTTQTAWQVVGTPAISTYCEDLNPLETYSGTLDVTGLANQSTFWLEAEVAPWIGDTNAVNRSETNTTNGLGAREFTRVYFYKDTARFAAPPVCYVNGTTGNDGTGVWSTTDATAFATPFATVKGAIDNVNTAIRGAPATGSDCSGCIVYISDNLTALTSVAVNRTITCAVIKVTRDSRVSRANAVVALSAAFNPKLATGFLSGITDGAIQFEDVTINRTVNTGLITGTAGTLRCYMKNVAVTNTGITGKLVSNCHIYVLGMVITGAAPSMWGQAAATENRIIRGLSVDYGATAPAALEAWRTFASSITRVKGYASQDPKKGAVWVGNKFLNPDSTTAPIELEAVAAGDTMTGIVIIQNLVEILHTTTSTPGIRVSSDTPSHGNINHCLIMHNVVTGYCNVGRNNNFYDNQSNATEIRTHSLVRDEGNILVQFNIKGDVFVATSGADPTDAPLHIGHFAVHHGVGCKGNFTMFRVASGTPLSEDQIYPGAGSLISTNVGIRQDPLFTNYQGTSGSGGNSSTAGTASAGAGGGTYTLQGGSTARGIVTTAPLKYDFAGSAWGASNINAGLYAA